MPFNDAWDFILNHIQLGQIIDNWTINKGYLGDQFTIVNVAQNNLQVDPPSAETIQSVPRDHFENVYNIWGQYRIKNYHRQQIRDQTRFSKYIISILHWVEINNNGILP